MLAAGDGEEVFDGEGGVGLEQEEGEVASVEVPATPEDAAGAEVIDEGAGAMLEPVEGAGGVAGAGEVEGCDLAVLMGDETSRAWVPAL